MTDTSRTKAPPAPMPSRAVTPPQSSTRATELRAVRSGVTLLWPEGFERDEPSGRHRGTGAKDVRGEGGTIVTTRPYVVDWAAPLERDVFCAGQEHKLRPLTNEERERCKGPTPIRSHAAMARIREAAHGPPRRPMTAGAATKVSPTDDLGLAFDDIPEPDPTPQRAGDAP